MLCSLPNDHGIYALWNLCTGKMYVGSAVSVRKRCTAHLRALGQRKHFNIRLQRSWDKHGVKAFVPVLLELVPEKQNLLVREQYWIDHLSSFLPGGYNLLPTAGSPLGHKMTHRQKMKISRTLKGRKPSTQNRIAVSKACRGRKLSKAHREKLIKANTGRIPTLLQRQKISRSLTGRKMPEAQRQKISEAMTGRVRSAAHRASLSKAMKGRHMDPAWCAKISRALSGKNLPPEQCRNISAGVRASWKRKKKE